MNPPSDFKTQGVVVGSVRWEGWVTLHSVVKNYCPVVLRSGDLRWTVSVPKYQSVNYKPEPNKDEILHSVFSVLLSTPVLSIPRSSGRVPWTGPSTELVVIYTRLKVQDGFLPP